MHYSSCHHHYFNPPTAKDDDDDGDDDYDEQQREQCYDEQHPRRRVVVDYEARIAKLEETRRAERTGRIRAEMKLRSFLKSGGGGGGGGGISRVSRQLSGEKSEWEEEAEIDGGTCHDDDDSDEDAIATTEFKQQHYDFKSSSKRKESKKNLKMHREQQQHYLLQLQTIGTIVSPYTKRMGTPRQGALVPSGRGYVQLTNIPMECLEGMEGYSHAWIIFSFHANTNIDANIHTDVNSSHNNHRSNDNYLTNNNRNSSSSTRRMIPLSKTKIRPPRGNGIKVGMLATRSPHRPNNIGLSLVRISHLDVKYKRLHITALDLVHGTPVYDIKPVVPWDIPGGRQHDTIPLLVVPDYVSREDDTIDTVQFTSKAQQSLEVCVNNGKLSPLYTTENNGLEEAKNTICQILAQDPRASNSNGPNKRGSTTTMSTSSSSTSAGAAATITTKTTSTTSLSTHYKMLFCSVEIEFQVRNNNTQDSDGDGDGENGGGVVVTVENIYDDLDLTSVEYVDGIPILLK